MGFPLLGCQSSEPAPDAGPVQDGASDASLCRGVGHYEVGKEGGYLPCCTNLHEVFQQVAVEQGDVHERVCREPVGFRNYACVEGSCGDGRCEAPESLPCGCPVDCPSAVWSATDAGAGADAADRSDAALVDAGVDGGVHASLPSMASALQDYLGWMRRTAQPQAISSEIFSLCRLPTQAEEAFVASQHGDNLFLLDWLNDAAVRGFSSASATPGSAAFPPGAAIVKQKLASNARGELELKALGLMIKHEPGFDAEHADWEFGYWTESAGIATGAAYAASCGGCHAGAKTDFVFLDQSWRL